MFDIEIDTNPFWASLLANKTYKTIIIIATVFLKSWLILKEAQLLTGYLTFYITML